MSSPASIFLLGTDTQIENGANAAGIAAKQGGLALIEDHQKQDVPRPACEPRRACEARWTNFPATIIRAARASTSPSIA